VEASLAFRQIAGEAQTVLAIEAIEVLSHSSSILYARSMAVPTSLLGPVRARTDSSTYPQARVGGAANLWVQATPGKLRRWIMLRCLVQHPLNASDQGSLKFLRSETKYCSL
jgi:hypothetical protein